MRSRRCNGYAYENGIWHLWGDAHAQRLRAMVQEACQSLKLNPATSLLNGVKAYIMDRPDLHRDDIEFDAHGLMIADDAVYDFASGAIADHDPEHFALFKVSAKLRGGRDCPAWMQFLTGAFPPR